MLIGRVENLLHRFAPILIVGRAGEEGSILNGLLIGRELPAAHPHLLLELNDLAEKRRKLLIVQARKIQ